MPKLLIEGASGSSSATVGGRPVAPIGVAWPTCKTCDGPMQFIAQLPLAECDEVAPKRSSQTLLIFQCQNDPGMCDEWDAESGGNLAMIVQAEGGVPLEVPEGETLLPSESRLRFEAYQSKDGESPDDAYCEAADAPDSKVIGKMGGDPLWIQNDETPTCQCGATMSFVCQLEDRGGGGINFGDAGAGYAFVCPDCSDQARFLWQSC
jgi:uncharacterized protein YwqG